MQLEVQVVSGKSRLAILSEVLPVPDHLSENVRNRGSEVFTSSHHVRVSDVVTPPI